MNTSCSTKTTTVISSGNININCFADLTIDDTINPNIYRADLLEVPSIINGEDGIEGELLISRTNEHIDSNLNEQGELVIESDDLGEVDKYSINEQGELEYNG